MLDLRKERQIIQLMTSEKTDLGGKYILYSHSQCKQKKKKKKDIGMARRDTELGVIVQE